MGTTRTTARVIHHFYWIGYQDFINRYCQQCVDCQKRKGPSKNTREAMKTYVVGETMDQLALDILGPLPQTYNGNKFLLVHVVTENITRFAEAYPLPNIKAQTVAEKKLTATVLMPPTWNQTTTEELEYFNQDMPDFAELLRSPTTPSPMRRLLQGETDLQFLPSDLVSIPSKDLFSKYLEPVSANRSPHLVPTELYSPDPPF
ncbi:unnamed protein product [Mytilus coruscus]|uniref:Integrase zinc-binding domain-containing protein n=1 Tax=Mytilus coruscus TaxID=42192 RepID=A0A6J8EHB2_MYTCO|nr:unnamed protein product [Mytilus coruscus]